MNDNRNKLMGKKINFVQLQNNVTKKMAGPAEVIKPIDLSNSWSSISWTLSLLSLLFNLQVAVSVNHHSGESKPPMYGDYEAQRHWMEVTKNLPLELWYINGTGNDLLYWGLDYPPLTAYHHFILGHIASKVNGDWVSLSTSHGFESIGHKVFMRISAIIPFYILYFPPLLYYFGSFEKTATTNIALALIYPAILVIDNGHFQYNSVSLGFFLATYVFLTKNYTVLGSILFVAALNYKQMELYHALPIFVFILSRSIQKTSILEAFLKVVKIGGVVVISFLTLWLPFLTTGTGKAVLERVFPFNRGLYEDKVASFWCAFSFILKRLPIDGAQMLISITSVLFASSTSLILLFSRPTDKNFRLSLVSTSLSFFLFSYQVHEKTILLATVPGLLLLPLYPEDIAWFLGISNISIFSLCIKDDFSTSLLLFLFYSITCFLQSKEFNFKAIIRFTSISVGFSICLLELYGPKVSRFPHIYQLGNALFSCVHLIYFLIFFTTKMSKNEAKGLK